MRSEQVSSERLRNPFHELFVTELLEDPVKYQRMFSPAVLVGETLQVFRPANTVVVGPQGSGKSMLLNLIRCRVVGEWLNADGTLPRPIQTVDPYLGVSVNLVRANFSAFGSRTISQSRQREPNPALDAAAACDFLSHVLLREFLRSLQFMASSPGDRFSEWAGMRKALADLDGFAEEISGWAAWSGWYRSARTLTELLTKCEDRIGVWRAFTNTNIETVPDDVWESKASPDEPLHAIGNLLRERTILKQGLPLFVSFDQYEVLPELNRSFGTTLQRVVNQLIKARDPVVFYKIGARTYDWGRELRVWPSDSRIEEQRDYRILDLAQLLMRHESGKWLFPKVASDVLKRRIDSQQSVDTRSFKPSAIFGAWDASDESWKYFKKGRARRPAKALSNAEIKILARKLPESVLATVRASCRSGTPLTFRLACAWATQQLRRGVDDQTVRKLIRAKRPWEHVWWRKERVGVALVQIASFSRQRKLYYGWHNILSLAGGNITAFIYMLGEVWDEALKNGTHPLDGIPAVQQSEGIRKAATRWLLRDRNEVTRGTRRFDVIQRLGEQIHDYLVEDEAISNPGHSGFSVSESALADPEYLAERDFLLTAVHWSVLEERTHTSKEHEGDRRRKFFLHPLLSPVFSIPSSRVKEPLYTSMETIRHLVFAKERMFVHRKNQGARNRRTGRRKNS